MEKSLPSGRKLALAAFGVLSAASASAATLLGPTTIAVDDNTAAVDVTTISTVDLSGMDGLVIAYGITRGNATSGGSWLTMTFNTADTSKFLFTSTTGTSVFGATVRTEDGTGGHTAWQATGSWDPNNTGANFFAATPNAHSVRVTIAGLSSGGFTGIKNVTFEVDHYASSFAAADKTFTGTIDFGSTDVGLNIDLRSYGASGTPQVAFDPDHTATNFTITTVPEPSAALLGGIGALLLLRRRR